MGVWTGRKACHYGEAAGNRLVGRSLLW
jgi:hypothetical protein